MWQIHWALGEEISFTILTFDSEVQIERVNDSSRFLRGLIFIMKVLTAI